jgi:hypothetical protein
MKEDFDVLKGIDEAIDFLRKCIADPDSEPSDRVDASCALKVWQHHGYLNETMILEMMVREKQKQKYRDIKKYMSPESYRDLLIAVSQLGYDISEIDPDAVL